MYDDSERIDWSDPALAARLLMQGFRLPTAADVDEQPPLGRRSGSTPGANPNSARQRSQGRVASPTVVNRGPVLQPVIDDVMRIARISQARHGSLGSRDPFPLTPFRRNGRHIAELAEQMEAGGRNPGMINPGRGDRGGASYGLPQLATNSRQPQLFLETEGRRWQRRFQGLQPGTPGFDRVWAAVAAEKPDAFGDAQRAYAGRNHYSRSVRGAFNRTGVNLDTRADAVRAATWSTALQHGAAPDLLTKAILLTDQRVDRASPGYDEALIKNIYGERDSHVGSQRGPAAERRVFGNIVRNRYPEEWRRARELLGTRR